MSNSNSHAKAAPSVLCKFPAFCSAHSLLKSDEELCGSFESFFVGNHASISNAEKKQHLSDFEAIEEILPVLYELGKQLVAEGGQDETGEVSQSDSSNHLYASLKRHPE